jgi:hypothetical protein
MTLLNSLVVSLPRGSEWSFALTISGLPDVFSDGKASWSALYSDRTDRPGTFTTKDLVVGGGSGPSLKLRDDGTDYLHHIFSVAYEGGYSYLAAPLTAAAASTTITVQDISPFAVDDYVYLGLETCKVTSIAAGPPATLTVQRAKMDTLRRSFLTTNHTGVKVTTAPRVMRGRFVEVWMAPIEQLSGTVDITSACPIWAGFMAEAKIDGEVIEIQTESLDKLLTSSWPTVLPTGSLYQGQETVTMSEASWTIQIAWLDLSAVAAGQKTIDLSIGTYDTTGTFTAVTPTSGRFAFSYLAKCLQDTLNNFFGTTNETPFFSGAVRPFANSMTVWFEKQAEKNRVVASWMPANSSASSTLRAIEIVRGPGSGGENGFAHRAFGGTIEVGRTDQELRHWGPDLFAILKGDTEIPVYCDNPTYPFSVSWERSGTDLGFARIQNGDVWEMVQFSGVTVDTDDGRRMTLTGCVRGVGGSEPLDWTLDEGKPNPAIVSQLLCMSAVTGATTMLRLDDVLAGLLMSTEDSGQQGDYDRLYGKGMGLCIPARYVDYDRMSLMQAQGNLITVNKFWIDEKGKGKDSLGEYLKMLGVYMITRRFTRGGTQYYGLSVDSIDPPVVTTTYDTFTDDDRLAGTRAPTEHNERLIINSISTRPFTKRWGTKETDGEPITEFDQWSIEEYGGSKTMEIKPTALYAIWDNSITGNTYHGREAQLAWLTVVAVRWFGAYGRGHYTIDLEAPAPIGWRFRMGDKILVSLTGVRDPEGNRGIVSRPAKVTELDLAYGSKGRVKIRLRMGYENFAELAPSGQVSAISATTMTLSANKFSLATWPIIGSGAIGATDADWFDPTFYGGNIRATAWTEGKWATTRQTFQITGRSGNVLTINTNLTALSVATNLGLGERTLLSFDTYSTTLNTDKQNAFAHTADNSSPPDINGGRHKEYR